MPSSEDKWKKWLLEGRFAGDAEKKSLKYLGELAETLLGFARLKESEVLLGVGAGDGLIAFAALPQLGKPGRVILSEYRAHSWSTLDPSRSACRCSIGASSSKQVPTTSRRVPMPQSIL
jgi:hypothetical protein